MIVLAVLLLVLVVAIVLFVVLGGGDQQVQLVIDSLNINWRPSVLVVFLLGALCLLLAVLALGLMRAGARRSAQRRREMKRLREVERERPAATDQGPGQTRAGAADQRTGHNAGNSAGHSGGGSTHQGPAAGHGVDGERERGGDPARADTGRPVAPDDPSAGRPGSAGQGGWHDEPTDPGRRGS